MAASVMSTPTEAMASVTADYPTPASAPTATAVVSVAEAIAPPLSLDSRLNKVFRQRHA